MDLEEGTRVSGVQLGGPQEREIGRTFSWRAASWEGREPELPVLLVRAFHILGSGQR